MTDLSDRMRLLADRGHARADELRAKAAEFDMKVNAMNVAEQTDDGRKASIKSMVGAWARARRVWCECTGEPLI